MSVRLVRKSWCVDFRFNYVRNRLRSPLNTRAGALQYEAMLRLRLAQGLPLRDPLQPKFEVIATAHLADPPVHYKPSYRPSVIYITKRHLIPFFGNLRLDQIGLQQIERYKAKKVAEGLTGATINSQLSILRQHLLRAYDGDDRKIPKMKRLPRGLQATTYLSDAESEQIRADQSDRLVSEMIHFALHTGMRIGEILALHWSDVDFEHNQVCVRYAMSLRELSSTKTYRIRYIPMTESVTAMLKARPRDTVYVFSDDPEQPSDYRIMTRRLHQHCFVTGVRKIGWHALRHTFASTLSWRGVHLVAVQKLLGHGSVQTTMRYTHSDMESLHRAVEVLVRDRSNDNATAPTQPEAQEVMSL